MGKEQQSGVTCEMEAGLEFNFSSALSVPKGTSPLALSVLLLLCPWTLLASRPLSLPKAPLAHDREREIIFIPPGMSTSHVQEADFES